MSFRRSSLICRDPVRGRYVQVDLGDVGALVRGKEQIGGRDLLGTREPCQRRPRRDLLSGFGGALLRRVLVVEHRCVNRARTCHVSSDLPILKLLVQVLANERSAALLAL